MGRYLEYDKSSGKIVSEVKSETAPEPTSSYAYLKIDEGAKINTLAYAVRNGRLVKVYETNDERAERERLRREHREATRQRLKSLTYEYVLALIDENEEAQARLKAEYRGLKVYM